MERWWAWLQNHRRLALRDEHHAAKDLGSVLLSGLLIPLKWSL
jgi:hypothetical protein